MAEPSHAPTIGVEAGPRARDAAGSIVDVLICSTQPPNRGVLTGTRGLMFAVLQNGIETYLRGKGLQRSEAEDWVRSRRRASPFSFTVLCEEFSLDPSAVRIMLAQMRDSAARGVLIRARPYTGRLRPIAAPTELSFRKRQTRRKKRCART